MKQYENELDLKNVTDKFGIYILKKYGRNWKGPSQSQGNGLRRKTKIKVLSIKPINPESHSESLHSDDSFKEKNEFKEDNARYGH